MFGIDSGELLIIAVVALVVIGPKDLPRVMRTLGNFIGRARGMARHFRSGFETMMREAELEEMEKTWKAANERIMREHPAPAEPAEAAGTVLPADGAPPETDDSDWGKPVAEPASPAGPRAPAALSGAGAPRIRRAGLIPPPSGERP